MSEQQSTKETRHVLDAARYRRHKRKKLLRQWGRRARRWGLWGCLYGVIALVIWMILTRIGGAAP